MPFTVGDAVALLRPVTRCRRHPGTAEEVRPRERFELPAGGGWVVAAVGDWQGCPVYALRDPAGTVYPGFTAPVVGPADPGAAGKGVSGPVG